MSFVATFSVLVLDMLFIPVNILSLFCDTLEFLRNSLLPSDLNLRGVNWEQSNAQLQTNYSPLLSHDPSLSSAQFSMNLEIFSHLLGRKTILGHVCMQMLQFLILSSGFLVDICSIRLS